MVAACWLGFGVEEEAARRLAEGARPHAWRAATTLLVWRLTPSAPFKWIPSDREVGPNMATFLASVLGVRVEWEATWIWDWRGEAATNSLRVEL